MFTKKECKCYKGMESEECCKSKVEEAVKHRTYIILLIISIALIIMALTVKTADNVEFVGQVSFASTITSIILSVIAIWMSITGERNTNEIRNKVTDAVSSLTTTTDASMKLSSQLNYMLDEQSKKYDMLLEKMQNNIDNSEGIKENLLEVKATFESINIVRGTEGKNIHLEDILTNVLESIRNDNIIQVLFDTFDYVIANTPVPVSKVVEFIQEKNLLSDIMGGYVMGIAYVCSKNGMLSIPDEYNKIKEKYIRQLEKKSV